MHQIKLSLAAGADGKRMNAVLRRTYVGLKLMWCETLSNAALLPSSHQPAHSIFSG